jgi:hypothetical protein
VNFEQFSKFAMTTIAAGARLGRLSQFFQSPHTKRDDRIHDHRFGCFQTATNNPIWATRTWSRAGIGADAVIGLRKLNIHDDSRDEAIVAGLLRFRLKSIV